jgi:hypothetical protein
MNARELWKRFYRNGRASGISHALTVRAYKDSLRAWKRCEVSQG